jgi:hypothetical protein
MNFSVYIGWSLGSGGESEFSDRLGNAKHFSAKPLCFLLINTSKKDLLMDIFYIP